MSKYRKLTHVYYKCDYHIVFTPMYRFQILEGMVKSLVEHDLQLISSWKDAQVIELNVQKRPYPFGLLDTTKGFNFRVHGNIVRKNGNQTFQDLSEFKTETISGQSFLVKRLFCEYSRLR